VYSTLLGEHLLGGRLNSIDAGWRSLLSYTVAAFEESLNALVTGTSFPLTWRRS